MTSITVPAYAKINLHLEVLGRSSGGYHRLETLFQSIGLCDQVRLTCQAGAGITLRCNNPEIPSDSRNLAWRAAALFLGDRCKEAGGLRIDLHKGIPHGAGLGGGSSDAAAVLRGLQQLLPTWRQAHEIQAFAAKLGADVPFFLSGGTALGLERGDLITPLSDLDAVPVTVLMPPTHLSTPAVFKALTDMERGPRTERGAAWWRARLVDRTCHASLLFNRLTAPAKRLCPAVADLLQWCNKYDYPYLMSGSGAACFVLGHISGPSGIHVWHTTFMSRSAQKL